MAENEKQQRPVRKLTVKNFSVIKEAELEFGKITVLIGPQASGKSLLCKLAYFFQQTIPGIIDKFYIDKLSYASLKHRIWLEFVDRFPEDSCSGQGFEIRYSARNYSVVAIRTSSEGVFDLNFGQEFEEFYRRGVTNINGVISQRLLMPSSIRLQREIDGTDTGPLPLTESSIFVPTGRSFFSTPNKGFATLSIKNLDPFTQTFAPEMDNEYKALRDAYASGLLIRRELGDASKRILKGQVVQRDGRILFESSEDGRVRPLEILSSGTLELLPIFNVLSQLVQYSRYPDIPTMPVPPFGVIYIEEPELSVFPSTQNDLVRLIAWLASRSELWMQFAITTHSPYVLSSFNNLIYAGQLGTNEAIRQSIPIEEKYWIDPGSFRAYRVHEGVLKPILSKSGLIDGEYLDSVSESIGSEFDSLLGLEYDSTKAS